MACANCGRRGACRECLELRRMVTRAEVGIAPERETAGALLASIDRKGGDLAGWRWFMCRYDIQPAYRGGL